MATVLKVDHREHQLKDLLNIEQLQTLNPNVTIVFENLYCGDFIIEYDGVPVLVLERKTLPDLVASIKDGRYKQQKMKLCETYGAHACSYIIEGTFSYSPSIPPLIGGISKKAVISSIINTQLRDGIKVIRTQNIQDTCDMILETVSRMSQHPEDYTNAANGGSKTSQDIVNIQKHKINNKEDMFFYQLTQVPGMSVKTANAFIKTYQTMQNFYSLLLPMNDEEKLKLLKCITIEDSNRRINGKVAESVIKFMF